MFNFYDLIDQTKIKSTPGKIKLHLKKINFFVCLGIMSFPKTPLLQEASMSFNFISDVVNLMHDKHAVHYSHITGEIVRYAHGFCNVKVRENKNTISVIAHNLFGFDFIFFLKRIRLSVWKTKNLAIGGSNLTNINYANIREPVKVINLMKYYQQSLAKLAECMTNEEKDKIKKESKNLIKTHNYFKIIFDSLSEEDQQ